MSRQPKIAIVGGGSVGLMLTTGLCRAELAPLLIVRREAQRQALERGLEAWDPQRDTRDSFPVSVRSGIEALEGGPTPDCVVVATRAGDTEAVAQALSRALPEHTAVASAQNDVEADAILAHHFEHVAGIVVRQTATRRDERSVTAPAPGRLVIGTARENAGSRKAANDLAQAFATAGFDVGRTRGLAAERWLKLCVNLLSVPNALVRRSDHRDPAFVALKVALLEEAQQVLGAAGLPVAGSAGDRTLAEEIAYQRDAVARGDAARALPLYNAVWRALHDHLPELEADRYHQRILDLAAQYGLHAPWNARALQCLREAARAGAGPEQLSVRALQPG